MKVQFYNSLTISLLEIPPGVSMEYVRLLASCLTDINPLYKTSINNMHIRVVYTELRCRVLLSIYQRNA